MKIDKQLLDDHQAKLTVEIEEEKMDEMKHRAAKKIARSIKIPGFRPGKAPYAVIARQVGETAIIDETIEMLIKEVYPDIIKEADIKPYGMGQLENIPSLDPVTLEFLVPLDVEVILGDYKSIRKEYQPPQISDKDINDVIANLQEEHAIVEPVDRPVELEDLVTAKILAEELQKNDDGESIYVKIDQKTTPILVRSITQDEKEETDNEWPFPGFSEKLIGSEAGDELVFEYDYPEDKIYDDFSGKHIKFTINIENTKKRTLPELDQEFLSTLGDFEDYNVLRERIRVNSEVQSKHNYDQKYDREIIEEAIAQSEFKYPPQMLEEEIDTIISNYELQLKNQNYDLDLYLKTRNLDKEAFKKEITPDAEFKLKKSLFLYDLAKAEGLEVDDEVLNKQTSMTYDYYTNSLSKNESRKINHGLLIQNISTNIMADMIANDAMEFFRNSAKGIHSETIVETLSEENNESTSPAETIEVSNVTDNQDMITKDVTNKLEQELDNDTPEFN